MMKQLKYAIHAVALCLTLTLSNSALATGLYKWVDKDGKVNYSTTRPRENENSKESSSPEATSNASNFRSKGIDRKPANKKDDEKISLNFNEVDLAKLFAIFADFSRNKIVIDPSIRQTVAVHYFDVDWEPTMYEIAARHNLNVKVENGTIYVKKNGPRQATTSGGDAKK